MLGFSVLIVFVIFPLAYIAYCMYRIKDSMDYTVFILNDIFGDDAFKSAIKRAKKNGSLFDKGL